MFICVTAIHHIMDPTYQLLETFQMIKFGEVSVGSSHFPPVLKVSCVWNGKVPHAVKDKYFSFQEETWDWTSVVKWNEIFGNSVFCSTGFTTLLGFILGKCQAFCVVCASWILLSYFFFLIWRIRKWILPLERQTACWINYCVFHLFCWLSECRSWIPLGIFQWREAVGVDQALWEGMLLR